MGVKVLIGKVLLWTKKNSPQILVGVNIASTVTAVGTAIKVTPKAVKVLQEHKEKIALIHQLKADGTKFNEKTNEYDTYEGDQVRRDLVKTYGKTAWELTKLYTPTLVSIGCSVGSVLGEHKIMATRNAALATTVELLNNQLTKYRERVKQELGEAKENELFNGTKEVAGKDKDGNEVKGTVSDGTNSPFEFWFNESSKYWDENTAVNVTTLLARQDWYNNKFLRTGFVYLDEVLLDIGITEDIIGKDRMKMAHLYGWKLEPGKKNLISFGLTDAEGHLTRDVIYAQATNMPGIRLNFNVDGNIFAPKKKDEKDYLDCHKF